MFSIFINDLDDGWSVPSAGIIRFIKKSLLMTQTGGHQTEHESAKCHHGKEGQWHPGLYEAVLPAG